MPLLDILTVTGFGFGAALSVILFSLSMQRAPKRFVDLAFAILFLSIILWFGGNFFAVLIDLLFGAVAALEVKVLTLIAYLGLSVTPSSLLHIQLANLLHTDQSERLKKRRIAAVAALYLPTLAFIISYAGRFLMHFAALPGRSSYISKPFLLWMLICIVASVAFSEKLTRTLKHSSDRRFYRDISYVLALIGVGVTLTYIFSFYRLPYIGPYLDLLMLLSPALPLGVLLYYVYRYNFYRLVIKPSFVYSILYGLLMAAYLLGVRRVGEYLKQFPEVNAELIEGLLLIALVFVFQPFRAAFQARLDKLFFRDRYYYQLFLRELSDSISSIVDLDELMETLRRSLKVTLKIKECAIITFLVEKQEVKVIKTTEGADIHDIPLLVSALQATRHFGLRRQMRDHRVITALQHTRFVLAAPVFLREEMRGLICLSEKESGNTFSDEELDVLQTFANQIGLALENARLVQERFELLDRIHQAEKLNSLGQLAATLSHEIKNPLSSIKAIIQVLHESSEGGEKADLSLVLDEINRLQTILDKLLNFARPPAAVVEKINLPQVVRDVLALLTHQARQANIELSAALDEVPPIAAKLNSVREIVFNLVLNAVQSIKNGGSVRVTVTHKPSVRRRPLRRNVKSIILLTVQDDGVGIPQEIRSRIFEPFYTSKTVGTGLGLAIVKRNVDELGGSVAAKSRTEGGTVFTVEFPAADEQVT